MTLSPRALTVSAAVSDPSPSATIILTLSGPHSATIYLGAKATNNLVSNVSVLSGTSTEATLSVQFTQPSTLGVGTYAGTLTIGAYYDSALTKPVHNSPQDVSLSYTVTPAPVPSIATLSPASATAGGLAFTLQVAGSNFNSDSVVQWNGSVRSTTFQSSSVLTATITASDIASAGTAHVTVATPSTGSVSTPVDFTISPPSFGILAISPSSVNAGGPDFTLTVNGAAFDPSAVIQWNGQALTTAFITSTQLSAVVPAADIAAVGTASITVLNPQPQGGLSNAATIRITPPDATGFQIDPAHTGAIQFSSLNLPATSAWTVTLDGPPSYPIIAGGKVIVTMPISGGGSELVALDQATGSKIWGPVILGGVGNATYDSGTVFVLYSSGGSSGAILQAFDASTGASKWSSALPGQYALDSAPTAANGIVYATESGSGVTLYAYDESNGNLKWRQLLMAGDDCAPAVTADGVYVSYPYIAADFDPLTGSQIWLNEPGGDGGGGGTPVVANGMLYAPNGFGTYNGQTFNAKTGALLGSYIADMPPAFSNSAGYFLQGGILRAIATSNNTVLWSNAGDGQLTTSPIIVNNVVFIGSASGNLYGFDASSGSQVWIQNVGAAIPNGARWGVGLPLRGLGAGDGLLVVPAGNTLTAFALN